MRTQDNLGIDLKKLSNIVSKRLNRKIEFVGAEKIESVSYHSHGFKLRAKNGSFYFVKKIKSHGMGFEFPERKLFSYLTGHGMAFRSGLDPKSIGVVIANKNDSLMMPKIDEQTNFYQIQEFKNLGTQYFTLLKQRHAKKKVDNGDLNELHQIADAAAKIHSQKHPSNNPEILKAVYNDSLRSALGNPELTLMILNDYFFGKNDRIMPYRKQPHYVGLMINQINLWKDRSDRLRALHGDFGILNIFFDDKGKISVIDHSRFPWGDPGFDIGWLMAQYLWLYHINKNPYYKGLGENFLKMYEKKTGDKEIRQAMGLAHGIMGLILICPRFYPNLDPKRAKKFFDNVIKIMKDNKFSWAKI
jgi:thiamine kinase-like enzyme